MELVIKTKQSCSCKFKDTFRVVNDGAKFKLYVNDIFVGEGVNRIRSFFENIKENIEEEDYNKLLKFLEE